METTYKIYSGNPKEGTTYVSEKDNIEIDLEKIQFESEGWVYVAWDMEQ
jgi:hypothetical protein